MVHIRKNTMKKHVLYSGAIVFGSLIIAAALVLRHPVPNRTDDGKQLQELRNRIGQLESKAGALEKELGEMRKLPQPSPAVIYKPANEVIPSVTISPTPAQHPPGWKPFKFNGTTYYFTPLGQAAEVSMAPRKQTEAVVLEPLQQSK